MENACGRYSPCTQAGHVHVGGQKNEENKEEAKEKEREKEANRVPFC